MKTKKVGIVGASGYVGAELLRLCAGHPDFEVAVASAGESAGATIASLYPSLAGAYGDAAFVPSDPDALDGLDVVFLAMSHGRSQGLVPALDGRVGAIVDLAADFRLKDPAVYARYYGQDHTEQDLLGSLAYGLPELFRDEILAARDRTTALVAAAGCYPTAAALALAPLVRANVISATGVVVDAASGVSGAGRGPAAHLHFAAVDENFTAYGLVDHRHTPEIEQATGASVLFTPHLAPMTRGIFATCYARPSPPEAGGPAPQDALAVLAAAYATEPFVAVTPGVPSTKTAWGSNSAYVTARYDARTGWVLALSAIDNLGKGAAGQAVQCANLLMGIPEATGLSVTGVYP